MRVLFLSPHVPFPPVGGGMMRTHHLLRALSAQHELTLVGFASGPEETPPPFPLRVISVPWDWPPLYREMEGSDGDAAANAAAALSAEDAEPWAVSYYDSRSMEAALRSLSAERFDVVLLEGTAMARFLPHLNPATPRILDLNELYSLKAYREVEGRQGESLARAHLEIKRTLRFERYAAAACALCLTCSEVEATAARSLLGARYLEVIPNGVDTCHFQPDPREPVPTDLLFTGVMSYGPNVEAVRYFAREVLPLVWRRIPGARLHVVGSDPAPEVRELQSEGPGVVVHGAVPDVRPFFAQASVVVVPVFHGGGTRVKVLEAAASGKAIVASDLGNEGLDFRDGVDLLIAYSPRQFADCVIHLASTPAARRQLGESARQVVARYDWQRIDGRLLRAVNLVGQGAPQEL